MSTTNNPYVTRYTLVIQKDPPTSDQETIALARTFGADIRGPSTLSLTAEFGNDEYALYFERAVRELLENA